MIHLAHFFCKIEPFFKIGTGTASRSASGFARPKRIRETVDRTPSPSVAEARSPARPPRVLAAALVLLIIAGAALAIYQYVYNRSLWHDEAVLSINIVNRDFRGLTRPLDFVQVAPIGYLWAVKLSTLILGNGEYGLRAVPLLGFLAAIPLLGLLGARLTRSVTIGLLAAAVFSLSWILLIYASEAKQYSTDAFVAVLMLYLTFALPLKRPAALVLYGAAGALAVWFSNPSVIILAACGAYLLYADAYKARRLRILWPLLAWAGSFGVNFLLFIRDHPSRAHQATAFREYMLPSNPLSGEFVGFLPKAAYELFFNLGFGTHWLLPGAVAVLGIGFCLWRRRFALPFFFALPPLLHLLLSGLKMYPFIARALLYTAPVTALMVAAGLHDAFEFARAKIPGIKLPRVALVLPVLIMFQPIARDFPFENQELRASLEHLRRNIRRDDSIYLYYGARPAFLYYQGRMGITNPVTFGDVTPGQYSVFDDELSKLAGRVYVVFSHVYPFTPGNDEETYMVGVMEKSGAELLDMRKFRGSSVYYFDTKRPRADSK